MESACVRSASATVRNDPKTTFYHSDRLSTRRIQRRVTLVKVRVASASPRSARTCAVRAAGAARSDSGVATIQRSTRERMGRRPRRYPCRRASRIPRSCSRRSPCREASASARAAWGLWATSRTTAGLPGGPAGGRGGAPGEAPLDLAQGHGRRRRARPAPPARRGVLELPASPQRGKRQRALRAARADEVTGVVRLIAEVRPAPAASADRACVLDEACAAGRCRRRSRGGRGEKCPPSRNRSTPGRCRDTTGDRGRRWRRIAQSASTMFTASSARPAHLEDRGLDLRVGEYARPRAWRTRST